jgi:Arc/MetJ-type ribon-helix-helix transcriptional regulator
MKRDRLTVRLSDKQLRRIEESVERGEYSSKSEAIRKSVAANSNIKSSKQVELEGDLIDNLA